MDGQGSPGSSNTKRTYTEGRSRNRLLQNNTETLSAHIGMDSGKANDQLELNLAREVKSRKKYFSKYILAAKGRLRRIWGHCLVRLGT